LNPAGDRKVERFGWTFAPGDKIMQIENDYDKEVYNGDIGYIDDVDPNAGEIVANFDGRSVTSGFGELDVLVPAYAATIHKSQGSEYSAVIIPMLTQHYAMLQRNLLYTGVTRGKRLVVVVGQKKAVAIAVCGPSGCFLNESDHCEKNYRPNDGIDNFSNHAAEENKANPRQEPASDKGANNPHHDVAEETESVAFHD
jgi:hypothetical protein